MRDVQRRDSPVWHSARGGWRESNVPGRGRPASQPRGGGGSASRPSVPRADGTVHSSPPFPVGGRYRHVVTRSPHRLPAVSAAWVWSGGKRGRRAAAPTPERGGAPRNPGEPTEPPPPQRPTRRRPPPPPRRAR